jgi:hypothetical protein
VALVRELTIPNCLIHTVALVRELTIPNCLIVYKNCELFFLSLWSNFRTLSVTRLTTSVV